MRFHPSGPLFCDIRLQLLECVSLRVGNLNFTLYFGYKVILVLQIFWSAAGELKSSRVGECVHRLCYHSPMADAATKCFQNFVWHFYLPSICSGVIHSTSLCNSYRLTLCSWNIWKNVKPILEVSYSHAAYIHLVLFSHYTHSRICNLWKLYENNDVFSKMWQYVTDILMASLCRYLAGLWKTIE